jgi:hypothetical protein
MKTLESRQPTQLNILAEHQSPIKLVIRCSLSPGDVVMLTAAIRDLHKTYPDRFITDIRTPCGHLFENSPYITKIADNDPEAFCIKAGYPLVHQSNNGSYHFIHGFRKDLESKLGCPIDQGPQKGDIHISSQEGSWYSQVYEKVGKNRPFWLINAGSKSDFTCKLWEVWRYKHVIDALPEILFVQVGSKEHAHTPLEAKHDNLINLVGQTDLRQLIRLVYWSAGCLSPVSLLMHLAAAVPMNSIYKRQERPCVVVAGGREAGPWEAYKCHQFLHTCGMLPCCEHGGCWRSRVYPIGDGDEKDKRNLCEMPVNSESGQIIPRCMDIITVDMVVQAIRNYMDMYDYSDDDPKNWKKHKRFPEDRGGIDPQTLREVNDENSSRRTGPGGHSPVLEDAAVGGVK